MEIYGSEINSSPSFEFTLSGEEAFFGILYAAVTADGKVCEQEIDKIWSIVDSMMLFRGIPGEKWNRIVDHLSDILELMGHKNLTRISARCLPNMLKETAFTIAIDLLFSDGVVNYQEKLFMEHLRVFLGIRPLYAEQVVEVMALRYLNV